MVTQFDCCICHYSVNLFFENIPENLFFFLLFVFFEDVIRFAEICLHIRVSRETASPVFAPAWPYLT